MERWLEEFFALTTYEISIPVLRDPALAPSGRTGLVVSTLMEHALHRHVRGMGWHEEYQRLCEERVVDVLASAGLFVNVGVQGPAGDGGPPRP